MGRRAKFAVVTMLFLVLAGRCFGQEGPKRNWHKQWIISVLALTAANVLDMRSSAGQMEANPFLRNGQGQFNMGRAFALKSVAAGSVVGLQAFLIRKRPEMAKPGAVMNFAIAGALAGVSVRNSRMQ